MVKRPGKNIQINDYKFYAEDLEPEKSQDTHETNVTKLMNGSEVVTLGAFVPMEWKFTTHLVVLRNYDKYNKMIKELDDHIVKVHCPEIGDIWNARCEIKRTPLKKWIELEFRLIQVINASEYLIKNRMREEPFINIYSARADFKNKQSYPTTKKRKKPKAESKSTPTPKSNPKVSDISNMVDPKTGRLNTKDPRIRKRLA